MDPDRRTIRGRVRVDARVVADELSELVLDLEETLEVESVRGADGAELDFSRDGERLACRIRGPDRAVRRGDDVAVTVAYRGAPHAKNGFDGFH